MLRRVQRGYRQLVTSAFQVVLLAIAAHTESREGWLICLPLVAALSLFAWVGAVNRRRAINDTPTSRIASAAQGYVELQGQGRGHPAAPLFSHLTGRPCLWYRWQIEEQRDNKWQHIDSGESQATFALNDGSGQCIVDPEYAEIIPRDHQQWRKGDQRYNEWSLIENEALYVLGDFHSLGGGHLQFDPEADLKALLLQWKQQPAELHRRFDLNEDGQIDLQEWGLARAAAKREVEARHQELRASAATHLIRAPENGRLYLISSLDPASLARRYLLWAGFHLLAFFAALIATAQIWQGRITF